MYVKTANGSVAVYPYSVSDLVRENPNTSFPFPLTEHALAEWSVFPVEPTTTPKFDPAVEACVSSLPVFQDGRWAETWSVRPLAPEEIAEGRNRKAESVRADRNARLAACDWTQLADAPGDTLGWANYRQSLRDIPDQPGFPWDVQWPVEPGSTPASPI